MEHERLGLRAAQAPVERDQLLEGAALVEIRVVEQADHDVGDVPEAVRAQEMPWRIGRERRERILALDAPVGEVVEVRSYSTTGPCSAERTSRPADVRVRGERGQQARVPLVDLLARHSARLVHQVDEAEVARRQHNDLLSRDVVLRMLLLGLAAGLAEGVADGGVVLVTAREGGDVARLERLPDELVEPVAVRCLNVAPWV